MTPLLEELKELDKGDFTGDLSHPSVNLIEDLVDCGVNIMR